MNEFLVFGFGFVFNACIALLIVRYIYRPVQRNKDYVLMFLTFNTLVYLIAGLLSDSNLSLGVGVSLFILFRILRFRTDPIPVREMTYQIVMMALPIINALLIKNEDYTTLIIANAAVAGMLLMIEHGWGLQNINQKTVTYERIEWIRPEHYEDLLVDLRARTGLEVARAEIGKIDFMHDVAEIKITYTEPTQKSAAQMPTEQRLDYSTLFSSAAPK